MKRKDENTKMEEMHKQRVEQMIKSAEGSAGHLHKITKPKLWRRRLIWEEEEEDARLLGCCEAKEGKYGQYTGNVMRRYRT